MVEIENALRQTSHQQEVKVCPLSFTFIYPAGFAFCPTARRCSFFPRDCFRENFRRMILQEPEAARQVGWKAKPEARTWKAIESIPCHGSFYKGREALVPGRAAIKKCCGRAFPLLMNGKPPAGNGPPSFVLSNPCEEKGKGNFLSFHFRSWFFPAIRFLAFLAFHCRTGLRSF